MLSDYNSLSTVYDAVSLIKMNLIINQGGFNEFFRVLLGLVNSFKGNDDYKPSGRFSNFVDLLT
jgi:hypothetical protein